METWKVDSSLGNAIGICVRLAILEDRQRRERPKKFSRIDIFLGKFFKNLFELNAALLRKDYRWHPVTVYRTSFLSIHVDRFFAYQRFLLMLENLLFFEN